MLEAAEAFRQMAALQFLVERLGDMQQSEAIARLSRALLGRYEEVAASFKLWISSSTKD